MSVPESLEGLNSRNTSTHGEDGPGSAVGRAHDIDSSESNKGRGGSCPHYDYRLTKREEGDGGEKGRGRRIRNEKMKWRVESFEVKTWQTQSTCPLSRGSFRLFKQSRLTFPEVKPDT